MRLYGILIMSFLLAARSTRAFTVVSRTARTQSRLWAGAASTTQQYSSATLARIDGLNAPEELAKLAVKLNTPDDKLQALLSQQLANAPDSSQWNEKTEYVHWLLSGNGAIANGSASTTNTIENKAAVQRNKEDTLPLKTQRRSFSTAAVTADGTVKTKKVLQRKGTKDTPSSTRTLSTAPNDDTGSDMETPLFADLPGLHPDSLKALQKLGLTTMTEIQAKTFAAAASGQDVLGRARTGTGKTIAFLLPAIEQILEMQSHGVDGVMLVVVSPTRELATQIANQAEELARFHRGVSVQVMFGGTNKQTDLRKAEREPTILVATPGRLLDHLQNSQLSRQPFSALLEDTPLLVLDETDRLLDMGFRKDLQRIMQYLPSNRGRQTLLFSATIPPELKQVMAQTMHSDYVEVDCIRDGDQPTSVQVDQSHVVIPQDRLVSSVVEVVRLAVQKDPDAKLVVFFPTANLVNFYAELFNQGKVLPVMELHSRKSQSYRTRVSDEFRNAKKGILFTSDVSARGVDYPGVTRVIQFGMPDSKEQYIHRLGRTGRADATGEGWLVLAEWEADFLKEVRGDKVDLPVDEELQELFDQPMAFESQTLVEEVQRRVRGGDAVLAKSASKGYQAFLGYYLGKLKRMPKVRGKEDLVDIANGFADMTGLYEPPQLTAQLVGKMGLKGVPGLNLAPKSGGNNGGNNNGRGNNRGRGGRR